MDNKKYFAAIGKLHNTRVSLYNQIMTAIRKIEKAMSGKLPSNTCIRLYSTYNSKLNIRHIITRTMNVEHDQLVVRMPEQQISKWANTSCSGDDVARVVGLDPNSCDVPEIIVTYNVNNPSDTRLHALIKINLPILKRPEIISFVLRAMVQRDIPFKISYKSFHNAPQHKRK